MKVLLALLICVTGLWPAAARAATPDPLTGVSCPGRVAVIMHVEHPENFAGSREHKTAWAAQTQSEVIACMREGTISTAYGYYLELKVMGRIVRYICLIGDDDERRSALASFDETMIEARPALLGGGFASLSDDLRRQVHSDCNEGRI